MADPLNSRAVPTILLGGLLCGVLDISAACVTWWIRAGIKPVRIFQSVASGWQGSAAFDGGWPSVLLGLAFHFLIATTAAAVFYLLSRRLTFLVSHFVISGFAYGILVQQFMSRVVVALSAAPFKGGPFNLTNFLLAIVTHMFCVGLPIAWASHRYSEPN
jgi:hypothetical protein